MTVWILLAAVAATLIFLSTLSQSMLAARPWRGIGVILLLLSLLAISSYLPINSAFFAWLVIMVAIVGFLPSIGALLGPRQST